MRDFDIHRHVADFRRYFTSVAPASRRSSFVDWMVFVGLKDVVPNLYMHRADRMGMAHGVELRVPFLDHHFVNLALSIPPGWKVRSGEPKFVLKKSLEGLVPHENLYRRKQGFCVPLEEWMQEAIVDHLERRLAGFCRETGLLDQPGIQHLVDLARSGNRDVVHSLWNVYYLMAWFDRWMR
jgi:asparagine synthase (glutamine-hydrolysing)